MTKMQKSTHLREAKAMYERGDVTGAIRHTFWHAYHVGHQDGEVRSATTHSQAYEALEFLEIITSGGPKPTAGIKEAKRRGRW